MKQHCIKNTSTIVASMIAIFGTLASVNAQIGYQPVSILQTNAKNDSEGDFRPVLASDRENTIVAAWHSRENLNGAGTDFDIFAARSEDGGGTWTNPVVVNSNGATDSQGDLRPDIATNAAGTWIVCWESTESFGGTGTDIFVSRSFDKGGTWTPAVPINDAINDSGSDMNPSIAADSTGAWIIVWDLSTSNGSQSVLMSRSIDEGLNWSAPVDLTSGFPGESFLPDVASDGNGNWVIGYATQSERSNVGIVRSSDRGATWSQPVPLHAVEVEQGQDFEVAIQSDGMGTWIAAWESGNALESSIGSDQDILFSRSIDQGQTWTAPAALNRNASIDGDATDQGVTLASPAPGKWVAAWTSEASFSGSDGDDNDVLTAVSSDGGHSWSAPVPVADYSAADGAEESGASIVVPVSGKWLVAWSSAHDFAGQGSDGDIVAVEVDGPAIWTDAALLSTDPTPNRISSREPFLISDGHGTSLVLWSSTDPLGNSIGNDSDILMTRSIDDGNTWTLPAALHTNASSDAGDDDRPAAAVSQSGTWIAVWASADTLGDTTGNDQDILYVTSTDGGATWSAAAPLNSNAANDSGTDFAPAIATDGNGRWIVVWESSENLGNAIGEDTDILYVVSSDDGDTWSPPAAVSPLAITDTGEDFVPDLATDEKGRWLVAWMSNDDQAGTVGTDDDIIFVTSDSGGTTWSAPMPLNTNAANDDDEDDDFDPSISNDGRGNWLAFWHSEGTLGNALGKDQDILYSRSTDNGNAWSPPLPAGAYAASDTGEDINVEIQTDGDEWVAVWESAEKSFAGASDTEVLFIRSGDAGATWSAPAPLAGDASTTDRSNGSPTISVSAAGTWLTAWRTDENLLGGGSDIQIAGTRIPSRSGAMQVAAGADVSILEGTVLFVNAARFTGPFGPHTASVDWGDGMQTAGNIDENRGEIRSSHLYVNDGSFTATVSVTNSKGQTVSDSFSVVVRNAAPDVIAGGDRAAQSGQWISFDDVVFIDSGYDDTHTAEIDWGDGRKSPGSVDPGRRSVSASHTYSSKGPFTVTVTVRDDAGAVGVDTFVVNPPMQINGIQAIGSDELLVEWEGGAPPYRLTRRNFQSNAWEEMLSTDFTSAQVTRDKAQDFFRVESQGEDMDPFEISIAAVANRAAGAGQATISATITVIDAVTKLPADPPSLSVFATLGIDSAADATVTRTTIGRYMASLDTEIAGTADVVVSIDELEIDASASVIVPAGAIVGLDPVIGDFAFPDGKSPLVVTVAAHDDAGNVAGNGFSNYVVTSELPFSIAYNDCHEAEISFTSERPGRFPVTLRETSSGLTESLELVFPVVGLRPALNCPVMAAESGANVRLTIPLDLYIPVGWNFQNASISVAADLGMAAIAGLAQVRDGDLEDGVNLVGAEIFPEGEAAIINIQLTSEGEIRPGFARLLLDFDTERGAVGAGPSELSGDLDITGVESDAPHPLFENTSVPISNDFPPAGGTYLCSKKDYYRGCVVYVRTSQDNKPGLTDAQICASHDRMNRIYQQGCIYFDKVIADFTAAGRPVERNIRINTSRKTGRGHRRAKQAAGYIRQALEQFMTPIAVRNQACMVVGIMGSSLRPKGVSMHATADQPCAPVNGSTLLTCAAFSNTRSLGHEIGHHLDPAHNHDEGKGRANRSNLMRPSDGGANGTGTFLKDTQIARMQNSGWLTKETRTIYYCFARY